MIFCQHVWDVRGVNHGVIEDLGQGTVVLYVCYKCGIAKDVSLNGVWSMEQLIKPCP
jgi:hypothetical protein